MKFSSKSLSQTITQLCLVKGIEHIVISPGSRNAPLVIGFTEQDGFTNYSIVDERCAAFFALGLAQQLRRPVAVVCTSGSALLNYYPAVAEAFYSDIPLVVISADRPEHLVEIGDGQTIIQEGVFHNHILYNANCREGEQHRQHNETAINAALNTAIELMGPVHINVPFSEPLYETVDDLILRPQHVPARTNTESLPPDFEAFQQIWNESGRKMILSGVMEPESIDREVIEKLAQDPSLVVLTETTSNLHHEKFFPAIDQLITNIPPEHISELRPHLLITFGGMIVSKRIKAFLRTNPPAHHWHIDSKKAYDTFFALTEHFRNTPDYFLKALTNTPQPLNSGYRDFWLGRKQLKLEKHREFLEEVPFSDLKAYEIVFRSLPVGSQLQVANSAAIRYTQLFKINPEIEVYCNRGTSGIDGSTSTAVGAAVASAKPVVMLSGDLSFFYDSNALWNAYIPKSFRIIVVNNSGGGIFRILPGAKEVKDFSDYFETRHNLNARHLCEMYNLSYRSADNPGDLEQQLKDFYNPSETAGLLEIFTPAEKNDMILQDYFKSISQL